MASWHAGVMSILDSLFIFGENYAYFIIMIIAGGFIACQPRQQQKAALLLGSFSFPLTYGLLKAIGYFYYDARPFVVGHFQPLIPHEANNGFPSDHTFIAAAISAVLWPFTRPVSLICWGLTALVAISRVYVGVHHAVDVIGSMVGSIVVTGFVCRTLLPRRNNSRRME
jgi:undecaprenyl-diphosphatase